MQNAAWARFAKPAAFAADSNDAAVVLLSLPRNTRPGDCLLAQLQQLYLLLVDAVAGRAAERQKAIEDDSRQSAHSEGNTPCDEDDQQRIVGVAAVWSGRVDMLVDNAGRGRNEVLDLDAWRRMVGV